MDHHSTRWLVLSLVIRKRSSRYCGDRRKREDREDLESICDLLTDPLVVLLLLDLLHLVQELAHAQLQLRQLVLRCDFRVVVGVFSHLDVQMDPLEGEQSSAVSLTWPLSGLLKRTCAATPCAGHMILDRATPTSTVELSLHPPASLLRTGPSWWSWSADRSDVLQECER